MGGVGGAAGPGPGEDARARYREYVNCLVRTGAITGYHPLGTARLGQPDDPKAVVDLELRSLHHLVQSYFFFQLSEMFRDVDKAWSCVAF